MNALRMSLASLVFVTVLGCSKPPERDLSAALDQLNNSIVLARSNQTVIEARIGSGNLPR